LALLDALDEISRGLGMPEELLELYQPPE